jgi:hypothetical protein
MGTNLPVVTLFNDMLLGSAPCWGCDSSPAGAAWWIAVGRWWCNHSPAVTTPAATWHRSPQSRAARLRGPRETPRPSDVHAGALWSPAHEPSFGGHFLKEFVHDFFFFYPPNNLSPFHSLDFSIPSDTHSSLGLIALWPTERPSKAFNPNRRTWRFRECNYFLPGQKVILYHSFLFWIIELME